MRIFQKLLSKPYIKIVLVVLGLIIMYLLGVCAGLNSQKRSDQKRKDALKTEDSLKTEAAQTGGNALNYEPAADCQNWGLGFDKSNSHARPTGNATTKELLEHNAYYLGPEEKVIYLTFDAGYENGNTKPILEALKKHKVKATFFVVGHFLETAPELVKQMVDEGHTVGNHTYYHKDMGKISDRESFVKELRLVEEKYKEITGEEMTKYYRPPQGKYSLQNLDMARELGYTTFFWSLAYVDWVQDDQPDTGEAVSILTERIHPGAIVLLHSTSSTNGKILDELLTKWEEMGYRMAPLSEIIK